MFVSFTTVEASIKSGLVPPLALQYLARCHSGQKRSWSTAEEASHPSCVRFFSASRSSSRYSRRLPARANALDHDWSRSGLNWVMASFKGWRIRRKYSGRNRRICCSTLITIACSGLRSGRNQRQGRGGSGRDTSTTGCWKTPTACSRMGANLSCQTSFSARALARVASWIWRGTSDRSSRGSLPKRSAVTTQLQAGLPPSSSTSIRYGRKRRKWAATMLIIAMSLKTN
mmetsp:Transcript_36666/g.114183  ORF Transcript_36666/g.114183 Transcript_36666/m.114183 type:complete len:229 (+) Transcript_36666:313-999(+)